MIKKIKSYINSGDQRTSLAKRNIAGSFGLKAIDVAIDFLIVPLSLAYLTQTDYGIWLMIHSMVNWLNLFDIGISHGYRNKLAIALSKNDMALAKTYTSTTYVIVGMISLLMALFGLFIVPFINWSRALNTTAESNEMLTMVMVTVVLTFALGLTLKIVTSVFLANQMPFLKNLTDSFIKILNLIGVLLIIVFTKGNLFDYALVFSLVPLLVLLISSLLFFNKRYKAYRPSFSSFDKTKINELLGLGFKFFIIQLGAIMLFMSDNVIIAHVLSPEDITPYQIAHKYFGVILIISSIIMMPFWTAITDAYEKKDYGWIKKSILSLNKIWIVGIVLTLILLAIFQPILSFWVGDDVNVSLFLAIQWSIFVVLQSYNTIYTYFLNGTGKVTVQVLTAILTLIINIPLSIYFASSLNMGSAGVLLATNCSILIYIIMRKIQYNKLINNTAKGIWNK